MVVYNLTVEFHVVKLYTLGLLTHLSTKIVENKSMRDKSVVVNRLTQIIDRLVIKKTAQERLLIHYDQLAGD